MPALRLNTLPATLLACLLPALMLACGGGDSPSRLPAELLERRAEYDTSRPWSELVRPHFFALDDEGKRSEIEGEPDRIVVRDGLARCASRRPGAAGDTSTCSRLSRSGSGSIPYTRSSGSTPWA